MTSKNCSGLVVSFTFLVATTIAVGQTQQPQGPSSGPPFGGEAPNVGDVGKNVVIGELKKIEKTKLTISRPDGGEQSLTVDANTKFFGEHGEAITLADFKTGERVGAIGTLKDGVFLAAKLGKTPSPSPPPPPPTPPNPSSTSTTHS